MKGMAINNKRLRFDARADGIFLNDERFFIKGASYFGMETDILVPHGLWGGSASTTIDAIATMLIHNHFNLVRLPLAMDAVKKNPLVDRYKMGNEATLLHTFEEKELRYLDVLDYVVNALGNHGLLVLLDAHVLTAGGPITPLWYDTDYETDPYVGIKEVWTVLAQRYGNTWNVIGADVNNEPHGEATWGSKDPRTDWRLAAKKVSNAILRISPHWLVFVQGVERTTSDDLQLPCFWAENLQEVHAHPLANLVVRDRLVYSPHVYGPSVANQPYFDCTVFPSNMPKIWEKHFGFVRSLYGPIVIGEWGGKYTEHKDRAWQQEFAEYLEITHTGFIYWCVNPNSSDTEGLLKDDWNTPRQDKLDLLSRFRGTRLPC